MRRRPTIAIATALWQACRTRRPSPMTPRRSRACARCSGKALRSFLFLDSDALARLATEKHPESRSEVEVSEFLTLVYEVFGRTAVHRTLRRTPTGWGATGIQVEGVSLAEDFRAQFGKAVAKHSFQGLLQRPSEKVGAPATSS